MDEEPIITGDEAQPAPAVEPAPPAENAPPAEPTPTPPPQDAPAPAKSGGGKGMIIAIAVIAVVAIVVIAFMFMGGGIEGKWNLGSAEVLNSDGTVNQTVTDSFNENDEDPWMEFKSDGTALMGNATDTSDMDTTWKTNDGKLTLTYSYVMPSPSTDANGNITWNNQTITDSMIYTYSISGNTLKLEFVDSGMTFKMTAKRV